MTRKIDELISIMDQSRATLESILGIQMNYTPQSLNKLEEALVRMFGSSGVQDNTAAMLGAYLGEVIKRNVKGTEWVDFDKYVDESHLITPSKDHDSGTQVNPFIRIQKFMADPTDGLYAFYCMIQDMAQGRLDLAGVPEGKSPRGYTYKVTSVSKELHARYEKGEITKDEMIELAQKEAGNQ